MSLKLRSCFLLFTLIAVIAASDQILDPADDPRNIIRPCPDFNVDCIRDYFWSNSECQIAMGPVPDPLFIKHYAVEFPNSNITFQLHDVNVEGLNGDVVEFYINTETEKLVLATRVESVKISSPRSSIEYNRKCKEPITRSDYLALEYGSVTFTAVFPSIFNLDLNDVKIFSYLDRTEPKYKLGPGFFATSDPAVQAQYKKLFASFPNTVQEGYVSHGYIFMINFIQYNICDFGLNLGYE